MRGAEGVMHKNIAQRGHLARQRFVVLFLALVQAAVLQHHQLAGLHFHAIDPVGHHGNVALHQLAQTLSHWHQRIRRLEFAFRGTPEVRSHHDRRASIQRHLQTRHRRPDARVLGDSATRVLRHIQISTDEHALASHLAAGAQIGKTDEIHDDSQSTKVEKTADRRLAGGIVGGSPPSERQQSARSPTRQGPQNRLCRAAATERGGNLTSPAQGAAANTPPCR